MKENFDLEKIRILIADDHAVVRRGLRTLLMGESDMELVGEAADGVEATLKVRAHQPDVILLDMVMPRLDGLGAIQQIKAENPAAKIMVLTSFAEDDKLFPAIKAGALGYLLKDSSPEQLLQAIRDVYHGKSSLDPTVAIKLIREEYSSIPEFQKNFIGEARLVADLIHTNIVQTYHLGQTGGQYFMTMEFVRGVNLEQFIERHVEMGRQVPVDIAAFIASRVCRGLSYAHNKRDSDGRLLGIVHRDVNPKNVMLAIEGDVKLTDFGAARSCIRKIPCNCSARAP